MSQFFQGTTAGSLPPTVPTSFVTDSGTAVPAANVLNIITNDTNANNDNGIEDTGSGNTVTILITNRAVVTATTVDATPSNTTVLTPVNGTSITFRVLITAYDTINNVATGGELLGLARKFGGVVTIVSTNDTFDVADMGVNSMGATDWDVIASGGDLQMQFVGIAARTIVWKALFEYIQSS